MITTPWCVSTEDDQGPGQLPKSPAEHFIEAVIGEITYRVSITVPEESVRRVLIDTLDPRLAFVEMISGDVARGFDFGRQLTPVVTASGQTVTWDRAASPTSIV